MAAASSEKARMEAPCLWALSARTEEQTRARLALYHRNRGEGMPQGQKVASPKQRIGIESSLSLRACVRRENAGRQCPARLKQRLEGTDLAKRNHDEVGMAGESTHLCSSGELLLERPRIGSALALHLWLKKLEGGIRPDHAVIGIEDHIGVLRLGGKIAPDVGVLCAPGD